MKTIDTKGCTFTFNPLATKSFNQNISMCECSSCRNFRIMVKERHPELQDFLNQFQVEEDKSDEIFWWVQNPSEKIINYNVYYSIVGYASCDNKYPIKLGLLNIFVQQPSLVDIDDESVEPYFVFEVKDIILPWSPQIDCENVFDFNTQKHPSWQTIKEWTKGFCKKS